MYCLQKVEMEIMVFNGTQNMYRILNFDFEVPNVNLKLKVNYEIVSSVFSSQFLLCTRTKDEKGNIIAHFFAEKRCPPNEKFQK